ncbi:MAG: hypothetical protein AAF492_09410, partial [Verrucomicrobiota bacterium]
VRAANLARRVRIPASFPRERELFRSMVGSIQRGLNGIVNRHEEQARADKTQARARLEQNVAKFNRMAQKGRVFVKTDAKARDFGPGNKQVVQGAVNNAQAVYQNEVRKIEIETRKKTTQIRELQADLKEIIERH